MDIKFNTYSILPFGAKHAYGWTKPNENLAYKKNRKYDKEQSLNQISSEASVMNDIGKFRVKHTSEVVLMFDSPDKIAAYVKQLNKRVEEHDERFGYYDDKIEIARGIVTDITSLLDCKIDFRRLGVDIDEITDDEAIEYGSKFAFWTTDLDGSPRNGRIRPGVVRSANEFMKLVEDKHPLYAAAEFEDIIPRLPSSTLAMDKRVQDAYDSEYRSAVLEFKKLPFSKKLMMYEPSPKYSPIYGNLRRLRLLREETIKAHQEAQEDAKRQEYKNWIDNTFMNTN